MLLQKLFKRAHPAVKALDSALMVRSSPREYAHYWAFRHPNEEMPPETFRLSRRQGAGWLLLLVASRDTKQVYNFQVETEDDKQAVLASLPWFGLSGTIADAAEGPVLKVNNGQEVPSQRWGGEKPARRR
jgi:hypothetical protein